MSVISRGLVALRWLVALGWIGATLAAVVWLPGIEDVRSGSLSALIPKEAQAVRAQVRLVELLRVPVLSRNVVGESGRVPGARGS